MPDAQHEPDLTTSAAEVPDHPIRYPANMVLGVLDTREQVERAAEALTGGGFLASEIEVATGPAVADAVHATTGRTGLAALAVRVAERLGIQDEEMEFKAHYEQALRDGRYVVMIKAPTEERKTQAAGLLAAQGAHSVSFHGRFTIEGIVPPR